MDHFNVTLKKLKNVGFGIIVSDYSDDKLKVIFVKDLSVAHNAGIKNGDLIVKINSKDFNLRKKDWVAELNGSKPSSIVLQLERDVMTVPRHKSFSTLNKSHTSNSSGSQDHVGMSSADQKVRRGLELTTSSSSMDLRNVTVENFVTEQRIGEFMQVPSTESLDHQDLSSLPVELASIAASNELPGPAVTRKSAYRRTAGELPFVGQQEQRPRIVHKQANRLSNASFSYSNEVNKVHFVYKKRNPAGSDTALRSRPSPAMHIEPTLAATAAVASESSYSSLATTLTSVGSREKSHNLSPNSLQTVQGLSDSVDEQTISGIIKSTSQEMPTLRSIDQATSHNSPMTVQIKMHQFYEHKIKKPCWKSFILEPVPIGVMFNCQDLDTCQMASNSTALDPRLATLVVYMNAYHTNNTQSRFLLPMRQGPAYDDIAVTATVDNVRVIWPHFNIDFIISLNKIPSSNSSWLSLLFEMLYIDPRSIPCATATASIYSSLPTSSSLSLYSNTKSRKSTNPMEASTKSENKKNKVSKPPFEIPKDAMLSFLPRSNRVKDVPVLVMVCISLVEKFGLEQEGVYRKAGNIADRKRLEENVCKLDPSCWKDLPQWANVHTVAGLLKSTMNKYKLFDKDTAIRLSNIRLEFGEMEERVQACMDMLYHLSRLFSPCSSPNYQQNLLEQENQIRLQTFVKLMHHLGHVAAVKHRDLTRMTPENLATCWLPNLMEDLPIDLDCGYQDSKRNLAEANLKKMLSFWIENANFIDKMLAETRDTVWVDEVRKFLEDNSINSNSDDSIAEVRTTSQDVKDSQLQQPLNIYNGDNNLNEDEDNKILNIISSYTSDLLTIDRNSGYNSTQLGSAVNTPDSDQPRSLGISITSNGGSGSTINKPFSSNYPFYQSHHYSKQKQNVQRRSSSVSPRDVRKLNLPSDDQKHSGMPRFNIKYTADFLRTAKRKKDEMPSLPQVPTTSGETLASDLVMSKRFENVPLVVELCVAIIERFSLDSEGIYRKSAPQAKLTILGNIVKSSNTSRWLDDNMLELWRSPIITSCLLKSLIKDLCLIPHDKMVHLSATFSASSQELSSGELSALLKACAYYLRTEPVAPHPQLQVDSEAPLGSEDSDVRVRMATLQFVLQHAGRVVAHQNINLMTLQATSICFSPVVMSADSDYSLDYWFQASKKNSIVMSMLILHSEWIFYWASRPLAELYDKRMTESLDKYLSGLSNNQENLSLNSSAMPNSNLEDEDTIDISELRQFMCDTLDRSPSGGQFNDVDRTVPRRHSDSMKFTEPLYEEEEGSLLIEQF